MSYWNYIPGAAGGEGEANIFCLFGFLEDAMLRKLNVSAILLELADRCDLADPAITIQGLAF